MFGTAEDTFFVLEGDIEVVFFNVTFDGFHVSGEEVRLCSTKKYMVQSWNMHYDRAEVHAIEC